MYARCGEVEKAEEIFENCPSRNAFTWTSLIAAYVEKGQPEDALICFKRMQREGLSPIPVTFTYILNACCSMGSVEEGGKIHNLIAQQGLLQLNPILGNAVVNMYAKCGALSKAQQVLEELSARNVNAWCALMSGYVNAGKGSEALSCYERMQHDGLSPDLVTFICLLKACGITKSIDKGEWIHHEVSQHGMLENNIELGTALVDMYAKCGALEKAQGVLKDLPQRNAITWSALIAGYAQQGDGAKAISCFEEMRQEGFYPDSVTFTCILNACGSIGAADKGEYIHDEILKRGLLENNIVLGNALVDMYAKCGAFKKAQQVLLKLVDRDVISWNALISGYSQHGKAEQALMCLMQMHDEGIFPNAITYTCILKACSSARAVEKGELMHEEIMRRGLLEKETVLGSALVEMYARCGVLAKARELLGKLSVQDLGSWLAVIAGYVRKCEFEEAFRCFEQMQCEGILPDQAILLYILNICGTIKAADKGVRIHKEVAKWGLLEDSILVGNALVDMYSKCDMTENARKVLEELLSRNVVTWNSLITGYAQCGDVEQAMKCLKEMQCDGIVPNSVTFTSILKACGAVGALNEGKEIHYEIARRDLLGSDVILGTSLVDMYAKCGALSNAQQVLQELPGRSIISWNAFIAGCIQKGDSELAFTAFKQLHEEGLSPNAATFSCMLSACNRSGQIKDAQSYFSDMRSKNGVSPDLEHYACMLDLLGRSGNVDKVMQVIQTLPTFHNGLWSVLLGACQKWGNMNVGKWAFQHAIQAEKHTAESNAIMSSTCATQSFFNE
ncbi:hypothetical protein KP509_14G013000 [Ceratopteris richardii]|nr:hypothetical protein KP509_14G013000 [Ceratopteris richardii]